jgi:RNA polymerase sigma factor (sigma-70 family)
VQPNRLPNDYFLHLVYSPYEDERQSQYLALLEASPQTKAEALAVINKAHYRHDRDFKAYRRKNRQLTEYDDMEAPQTPVMDHPVSAALDSLPGDGAELIRMHVLDGISLRDIAEQLGVNRETLRRRYKQAEAAVKIRVCQFGKTKA